MSGNVVETSSGNEEDGTSSRKPLARRGNAVTRGALIIWIQDEANARVRGGSRDVGVIELQKAHEAAAGEGFTLGEVVRAVTSWLEEFDGEITEEDCVEAVENAIRHETSNPPPILNAFCAVFLESRSAVIGSTRFEKGSMIRGNVDLAEFMNLAEDAHAQRAALRAYLRGQNGTFIQSFHVGEKIKWQVDADYTPKV